MNNEKIKVSVIMANYNNDDYLPDSIESVLNQTYKNIELIIIDDNPSNEGKAHQDIKNYQLMK